MNLETACHLATSHLTAKGLSDITKDQLEQTLLKRFESDFIEDIRLHINKWNLEEAGFKPIHYILTPKNSVVFDYRRAAIIDPSCLAKYTALVLLAAERIESARIPTSENIVFSYRFDPNGNDLFKADVGYNEWRAKIKELAESSECTYIVKCDIASFYDRVNIHRIESTLQESGVDRRVSSLINEVLTQWTKKDSYGIPIGNSASRILAEAALIDIDRHLLDEHVRFIRYVDDYRLFAPNLVTAQRWMNILTTRLFRDGLMLNTGKTTIYLAKKHEEESPQPHDKPEEVVRQITKLTGGYNRIARKFIMPASEKHAAFQIIKIKEEMQNLGTTGIPEFSSIQKLIIACLVQQNFELLEKITFLCCDFMYALDYLVDMLKKNHAAIPQATRDRIADHCASIVCNTSYGALEWHRAVLVSLLSTPEYFRKQSLIRVIRSTTKDTGSYPSIIALEGLKGRISRTDFKTIREWFDVSNAWEKRRIMNLSDALPEDERKAWGRAIKTTMGSDFLGCRLAHDISKGKIT